ncbi:DUF6193 family natural product biosynthesis protein [Streptomyces sp. NPDC059874]|uniref:DUF6193 family natural product biosynthesis protein n=1 Tax=Streptomyces sp. NPDC059874 TaxID=3346983 RepID=UPI003663B98C
MTTAETPGNAAEIVADKWQSVLKYDADLIDPAVVRAAYAQPRLRELFPTVSHGSLYLSRCISFPRTTDVGTVIRSDGRLLVFRPSDGATLGMPANLEQAIEIIVANLPEGCGPAILGTKDDL